MMASPETMWKQLRNVIASFSKQTKQKQEQSCIYSIKHHQYLSEMI